MIGGLEAPHMAWLDTEKYGEYPTPNQSMRGGDRETDTVVIHYTAGNGDAMAVARYFSKSRSKASSHFVIGREGDIIQCVPTGMKAWHAGKSRLPDAEMLAHGSAATDDADRGVNDFSIGIELCNRGWSYKGVDSFIGRHRNTLSRSRLWEPYPTKQIEALTSLLDDLRRSVPTLGLLTGHEDIRNAWIPRVSGSKLDPGPAFPWGDLPLDHLGMTRVSFNFKLGEFVADWNKMSGINKAILLGNIGRDIELKNVKGTPVCQLSIATSEKWTDKDSGEKKERTEWHRVNVWGPQAEHCARYLGKGSQVYVEGKIETRTWDKDGVTQYSTEIRASDVQFVGQKLTSSENRTGQREQHQDAGGGGNY